MFFQGDGMSVEWTALGSGSKGNCSYLEYGSTRLLIDAGLSGKQIRERLAAIGKSAERLNGILLTHEHSDHIQGLAVMGRQLGIPVFCNRLTADSLPLKIRKHLKLKIFSTGSHFTVGEIDIEPASIPHDAADPVSFLIHAGGFQMGILTDLGHVTRLIRERFKKANALLLETNYDLELLRKDVKRPWSIKQRIQSRHGHLSNEDAANFLEEIMHADLADVTLGHLSQDCNDPETARSCIQSRLELIGAGHVKLQVATQERPCATIRKRLESSEPQGSLPLFFDEPQPANG